MRFKENIPLLSDELLAKINAVVARHGYDIILEQEDEKVVIKIE